MSLLCGPLSDPIRQKGLFTLSCYITLVNTLLRLNDTNLHRLLMYLPFALLDGFLNKRMNGINRVCVCVCRLGGKRKKTKAYLQCQV